MGSRRQSRYWQIAKQRFLVTWNGIKIGCSIIFSLCLPFMPFYATKNPCLVICQYRPCIMNSKRQSIRRMYNPFILSDNQLFESFHCCMEFYLKWLKLPTPFSTSLSGILSNALQKVKMLQKLNMSIIYPPRKIEFLNSPQCNVTKGY